jgi:hypothetical protein
LSARRRGRRYKGDHQGEERQQVFCLCHATSLYPLFE